MEQHYTISSAEDLIDYLAKQHRSPILDSNFQLKTNAGFVHELLNGEVIFLPNDLRQKGILFKNKNIFEEMLNLDSFPIANPGSNMFDTECERIKTFHLQADHYRKHLNKVLKFDFDEITKDSAQAYLKKVIGRKIKGVTTGTDVIALISVIGELVKRETNGKWFLEKYYGVYNPMYEPNIHTESGNVFLISSQIMGFVKWRVSTLENIFISAHSTMTVPIKWINFQKNRKNLILLE